MHRLSLVAAGGAALHCSARASHCDGFSCCRGQALDTWASVVEAHRLSYPEAYTWDLPAAGMEPMSLVLARVYS